MDEEIDEHVNNSLFDYDEAAEEAFNDVFCESDYGESAQKNSNPQVELEREAENQHYEGSFASIFRSSGSGGFLDNRMQEDESVLDTSAIGSGVSNATLQMEAQTIESGKKRSVSMVIIPENSQSQEICPNDSEEQENRSHHLLNQILTEVPVQSVVDFSSRLRELHRRRNNHNETLMTAKSIDNADSSFGVIDDIREEYSIEGNRRRGYALKNPPLTDHISCSSTSESFQHKLYFRIESDEDYDMTVKKYNKYQRRKQRMNNLTAIPVDEMLAAIAIKVCLYILLCSPYNIFRGSNEKKVFMKKVSSSNLKICYG